MSSPLVIINSNPIIGLQETFNSKTDFTDFSFPHEDIKKYPLLFFFFLLQTAKRRKKMCMRYTVEMSNRLQCYLPYVYTYISFCSSPLFSLLLLFLLVLSYSYFLSCNINEFLSFFTNNNNINIRLYLYR